MCIRDSPCFYLRLPEGGKAVAFNERYQNAGLARQAQADTVVLGTSMVANYRPSQIAEVFGGSAVPVSYTHLDVYKRQVQAGGAGAPGRGVCFGHKRRDLVGKPASAAGRYSHRGGGESIRRKSFKLEKGSRQSMSIAENIAQVRAEIARVCREVGRDPQEIRCV